MPTATLVKAVIGWQGDASLYKLSKPATFSLFNDDDEYEERETEYVIVSAVNNHLAHETYIFPAYDNATPISMSEMEGSYKGGTDHEAALNALGYELV